MNLNAFVYKFMTVKLDFRVQQNVLEKVKIIIIIYPDQVARLAGASSYAPEVWRFFHQPGRTPRGTLGRQWLLVLSHVSVSGSASLSPLFFSLKSINISSGED